MTTVLIVDVHAEMYRDRLQAEFPALQFKLFHKAVEVTSDLDHLLPEVDVVYLLRIQRERIGQALFPSLREYSARWGLSVERAALLKATSARTASASGT